ncbi:hypothetical protein L195_g060954, partial [Trifolium pratense]
DYLKILPACLNPQVADCFTWKGNLNGIYSARDGYFWLNRGDFAGIDIDNISWNWLWQGIGSGNFLHRKNSNSFFGQLSIILFPLGQCSTIATCFR